MKTKNHFTLSANSFPNYISVLLHNRIYNLPNTGFSTKDNTPPVEGTPSAKVIYLNPPEEVLYDPNLPMLNVL